MDVLARIKRCALLHRVRFTQKADQERIYDGLTELEIFESLVNATHIKKTLRSTDPSLRRRRQYLYVIHAPTVRGEIVYTKGRFLMMTTAWKSIIF